MDIDGAVDMASTLQVDGAATFTTEITANGGIALGDSDKATFGAGDDLAIYSTGANGFIENEVGLLILKNNSDDRDIALQSDNGSGGIANYLLADGSTGALKAYHYGSEKLATTATGIDVTGTATMDGLVVDGTNGTYTVSTNGNDFYYGRNGANYHIANTANGAFNFLTGASSANRLNINNNGDISFYEDTGSTAKMVWKASDERLGIGTSSPATLAHLYADNATLTIQDSNNFTDTRIKFLNGSSSIMGQVVAPSDAAGLEFYYGTLEAMRIDASGRVGIGTSSPSVPLEISNTYPVIRLTDSDGTAPYAQIINSAGILQLRADDGNSTNNSSMQFYVDGSEAMRIDSSGNVGIGVGNSKEAMIQSTNSGRVESNPAYSFNGDLDTGMFNPQTDNTVAFATGGSERMRIDNAGNALVGTTNVYPADNNVAGHSLTAVGQLQSSVSGYAPFVGNRKTSNGDIVLLKKDGTTIGSIGSGVGDSSVSTLYIADAGNVGIRFDQASTDDIQPCTSTGTDRDNAINLGASDNRFKDLYLSGGVYLGGTGAANKLDDYEEGAVSGITCTGSTSGSATVVINNAKYTKIGNVVNLYLYLTMDFSNDNIVGNIQIANLPFANENNNLQNVSIIHQTVSTTHLVLGGRVTSNMLRVQTNSTSTSLARADCVSSVTRVMMIGLTYNTNA